MSWNYRVVRKQNPHFGQEDEPDHYYGIHEVYYDKNGNPSTVSVESQAPFGESRNELWIVLDKFREAFTKPILDFENIGS